MRTFSFIVEDRFKIDGRRLIVVPGFRLDDDPYVMDGDPVIVTRPDGSKFETFVGGIPMVTTLHRNCIPVALPQSLEKSDVPVGSTITIHETRQRDDDPELPQFEIGQSVSVEESYRNKTARAGTINRKVWHHKYQVWNYYIVDSRGKPVTKRYLATDFAASKSDT